MEFIIVAIDGGAASGKSSTSRGISERFHFLHVDTGSFYRAVAAELLRNQVAVDDVEKIREIVSRLAFTTRVTARSAAMEINGRVAGDEIRGPEVTAVVSHFAAVPEVRAALLAYQRGQVDVAKAHGFKGLVMEGRDIGTVIFPNADFRFYLHADAAVRANRRELEGRQDKVAERDRLDSQRTTAPLTRADGAIDIDSTFLSLQQVIDRISELISARLSNPDASSR